MKKYFQTKSFLITIITVLFIVIFFMLFSFFSRERLFKKDMECVRLLQTAPGYCFRDESSTFFSSKLNSCVCYSRLGAFDFKAPRVELMDNKCGGISDKDFESCNRDFNNKIIKKFR